MGKVEITIAESQKLRSRDEHFAILVRHFKIAGEKLAEERGGCEITEKPASYR